MKKIISALFFLMLSNIVPAAQVNTVSAGPILDEQYYTIRLPKAMKPMQLNLSKRLQQKLKKANLPMPKVYFQDIDYGRAIIAVDVIPLTKANLLHENAEKSLGRALGSAVDTFQEILRNQINPNRPFGTRSSIDDFQIGGIHYVSYEVSSPRLYGKAVLTVANHNIYSIRLTLTDVDWVSQKLLQNEFSKSIDSFTPKA